MDSGPHLSAPVLERLLAGHLPAEEEDALREHLAGGSCPTCAAGLADVGGTLVRRAVRGMLPKGRLGAATMKRLRIFAGPDHRHQAQQPAPLPVRTARTEK